MESQDQPDEHRVQLTVCDVIAKAVPSPGAVCEVLRSTFPVGFGHVVWHKALGHELVRVLEVRWVVVSGPHVLHHTCQPSKFFGAVGMDVTKKTGMSAGITAPLYSIARLLCRLKERLRVDQ